MNSLALAQLDAIDAFKLAIEQSNKGIPAIAKEMEWSESHTRRIFSTENYFPSVIHIPQFCHVVGNKIILRWLHAKTISYGTAIQHQGIDCETLVLRLGKLFAEVGDVGRRGGDAIEDNKLDPRELRILIDEIYDVLTEALQLVGDLRSLERELTTRTKESV